MKSFYNCKYYCEMERKRSRSPVRKDFKPSGILGKYESRKNGEVLLYCEPLDGCKPIYHWQLFRFIGDESVSFDLNLKSHFSIGRDSESDVLLEHASISKQHAVIQFRNRKGEGIPFIIDLNSKYGCQLNGNRIDSARFVQLKHKDLISFGTLDDDFILIKGEKITNIAIE